MTASEQDRAKPHEFKGRPDHWCKICNLPDRNPIHIAPVAPATAGEPAWYWHNFGAAVWLWLADRDWDGEDGWEIAELAVAAGLAERVKYDPEKHGECEADPGDEITWPLRGDPLPLRAAPAEPAMVAVRRAFLLDVAAVLCGESDGDADAMADKLRAAAATGEQP